MRPEDLAALTGISPATLANWRSRGVGPGYYSVGRKILYAEEDVDAWLRENRHHHANTRTQRSVALPVLRRRPRVQRSDRLGRHRTQQDRRAENRGEGAGVGPDRPGARVAPGGEALQ
ncbi:MAG: helix-turn-helix domain-containing protein [Acidobacteria bacterium]|nr:helix-turn-helix domain-containing protein [Acidobacteriota bacterium]